MAVVKVDASEMFKTILARVPTKGDIKKIKRALGAAARNEWLALAQSELLSSSNDYQDAIQETEITDSGAVIRLVGVLPNMVEQGWGPHDLRTTVLRSAKARTSKAGHKYLSVPFRHGTPGSTGRNVGAPMPRAIHQVAKHLKAYKTQGTSREQRLGLNNPHLKLPKGAKKILKDKKETWHSTSIYAGMIRKAEMKKTKKGLVSKTTGYHTFRTISEVSKNGWMHRGIDARKLADKVLGHLRDIAADTVQDAMR